MSDKFWLNSIGVLALIVGTIDAMWLGGEVPNMRGLVMGALAMYLAFRIQDWVRRRAS